MEDGEHVKEYLYEAIIVPTECYGTEAYCIRCAERINVNVLEMKHLRTLMGVSRINRVRKKRCVEEIE